MSTKKYLYKKIGRADKRISRRAERLNGKRESKRYERIRLEDLPVEELEILRWKTT